jgi:DNA-binding LacI/PurR family transcriptional regulator
MSPSRTPTLDDVALAADVSRATASRVINGSRGVSGDSRSRVLRAAEELGYLPNIAAASLVTRRSRAVALVICGTGAADDRVLAAAVRGATRTLTDAGLLCLVQVAGDGDDRRQIVQHLRTARVDGAVVVTDDPGDPICRELSATVPVVLARVDGAAGDEIGHTSAYRLLERLDRDPPARR